MLELEPYCLVKEMHKKCLIINKDKNNFLEFFLLQKKFIFLDFDEINNLNFPELIIVNNNVEKNELEQKIKYLESLNLEFIFMLPVIFKSFLINFRHKKIFYPIHISKFERLLNNRIQKYNDGFKDVLIKQDNLIINKDNGLRVYLTDTEITLVINLIKKEKIKKDDIRKNILNFNYLSDTRSLESHLSRIRKKLTKINSKINISTEEGQFIKIS